MASGQAKAVTQPSDWQTVQPNDWQDASVKPPAPVKPSEPTGIQALAENSLPHAIMHPIDAMHESQQEMQAHPIRSAIESAPGVSLLEGAYQGAKRSGGELMQGARELKNGNPWAAVEHGVNAVPMVGPAIVNAAEKPDVGGTGSYIGDVGSVWSSPSAMGTLTSAAAQGAGAVEGASGLMGREGIGAIPTRARAGKAFEDLNAKMANTPVPLAKSLQPLDEMAKYGEAGAQLPPPASKLLARSQATFPMEYPEARRFQETLSSLSRADRDALSGSQGGNLKQLNSGLYDDIHGAVSAVDPGYGAQYAKAMRDYRIASQLRNGVTTAAKVAIPAAVGGGLLAKYLKPLIP